VPAPAIGQFGPVVTYHHGEPFLRDHTIAGKQVLIGVTHASLAINAYLQHHPEASRVEVQKLNFVEPIELTDGQAADVQVRLSPASERFEVYFRIDGKAWRLTATGSVLAGPDALQSVGSTEPGSTEPGSTDLSSTGLSLTDPDRVELAQRMASLQPEPDFARLYTVGEPLFGVGRSFRVLDQLFVGPQEALAHVRLEPSSGHAYHLDPLLTYGAFTALVPLLEQAGLAAAYLPFGIKRLAYQKGPALTRAWLHVRLQKSRGELILFDVDLLDDSGRKRAVYQGCSMKRLRAGAPRDISTQAAIPQVQAKRGDAALTSAQVTEPPTPGTDLSAAVLAYLQEKLQRFMGGKPDAGAGNVGGRPKLRPDTNLMESGLDSLQLVALTSELEQEVGTPLDPTLLFEYPNLKELSVYLAQAHGAAFSRLRAGTLAPAMPAPAMPAPASMPAPAMPAPALPVPALPAPALLASTQESTAQDRDIAIIGMSGQLAQSPVLETFWQHLAEGRRLVQDIPADRWDVDASFDPRPGTPNKSYCRAGSFIELPDAFDPAFFGLSETQARWMDPQTRLFLQAVYAAVEDAAVIPPLRGSDTGVFVGICSEDYAREVATSGLPITPYSGMAGSQGTADRVSFWLDLKGPSQVINTACSSSLVALHAAQQALRSGACGMALVGGVNLLLSPSHYQYFSAVGSLSASGQCHTFDGAADGYVPGEAVVCLVLKPLAQARRDGDRIYGILKGSAALHAGHAPSFTAPSVTGQANVLVKAWQDAGITPESLSYLEAHGTGTRLGDSIEVAALKKAVAQFRDNPHGTAGPTTGRSRCALGSVKANLGHTEGASGLVGVVKVLLQMQHRQLPPLAGFQTLNPFIHLEDSPFYIHQRLSAWETMPGVPRRAGVSAFGYSGSYAHVVLEEAPELPQEPVRPSSLLVHEQVLLSARTPEQLRQVAARLKAWVQKTRAQETRTKETAPIAASPETTIRLEQTLIQALSETLQVPASDIDAQDPFEELGLEPLHWQHLNWQHLSWPGLSENRSGPGTFELTHQALQEHNTVRKLAAHLASRPAGAGDDPLNDALQDRIILRNVAHTLQVGRETFEARLGLKVPTLEALEHGLERFLTQGVSDGMDATSQSMDWDATPPRLEGQTLPAPRRIGLPTYPFAQERYWFQARESTSPPERPDRDPGTRAPLPPPASASGLNPAPAVLPIRATGDSLRDKSLTHQEKATLLLRQLIAYGLERSPEQIPIHGSLLSLGLGSLGLVQLAQALEQLLEAKVSPGLFFEFSTVQALAEALVERYP